MKKYSEVPPHVGEHLRSSLKGSYAPNTFLIRLKSNNYALEGDSESGPPVADWAVLMHEYFHFLQNTTSFCGLYDFVAASRLLVLFSDTLLADGTSEGSIQRPPEEQRAISQLIQWLQTMRGAVEPECREVADARMCVAASMKTSTVEVCSFQVPEKVETKRTILHLSCDLGDGPVSTTFEFGSYALQEGLAWELERTILQSHFSEPAIARQAPPYFPYGVMRTVFESYVGVPESSESLIKAGTLALQSPYPGATFIDICSQLKETKWGAHEAFPQSIIQTARAIVEENCRSAFATMASPLFDNLAKMPSIAPAIRRFASSMESHILDRATRPFFEFELTEAKPGLPNVTRLLDQKPLCPVVFGFPKDALSGRQIELTLIGTSSEQVTEEEEAYTNALGVYQAMRHVLLSHLRADRFAPSEELEKMAPRSCKSEELCCPFYGACVSEQAIAKPEICMAHPWHSPIKNGQGCLYAVAVSSLKYGGPSSHHWPI